MTRSGDDDSGHEGEPPAAEQPSTLVKPAAEELDSDSSLSDQNKTAVGNGDDDGNGNADGKPELQEQKARFQQHNENSYYDDAAPVALDSDSSLSDQNKSAVGTGDGNDAADGKPELQEQKARFQQHNENSYYDDADTSCGAQWSRAILRFIHEPLTNAMLVVSGMSARNPKRTVAFVIFFSFAMLVLGLLTNFNVDVDEDTLWSPRRSRPMDHLDWVDNKSGFPREPRFLFLNVHIDGANVLATAGVERVFEAVDAVRNLPGYDEVCLKGTATKKSSDGSTTPTCNLFAATSFWGDDASNFDADNLTDEETLAAMSVSTYPDGTAVDIESVIGTPTYDDENILKSARIFLIRFDLPETDEALEFEELVLETMFDMQDDWNADSSNPYKLEVFAERSFSDEFTRAIVIDIPLVPLVFVVMSIFTCVVFFRRDYVKSKMILGFGAVVSVFLSIMTGYGLLFLCGIPFTSMTQILPFIMFGIGMDDAFIISGSFYRTDPNKPIEARVEETIRDVGVSIILTTTTSAVAFGLGCISSIPAVYWLCLYAFPTIVIDFIYQITFFVALLVIDERRVQDNRRDCCVCITVAGNDENEASNDDDERQQTKKDEIDKDDDNDDHDNKETLQPETAAPRLEQEESMIDSFMVWYAHKLLQPWVKVFVIAAFLGLAGACTYSASLLTQEFDFTDVVPADSYIKPYWDAYDSFTVRGGFIIEAYFRNVDQSSPDVREDMKKYVDDIVGLDEVTTRPPFFWVEDFEAFVDNSTDLQDKLFEEQFDVFFAQEENQKQYRDYIVVDNDNKIVTSRVSIYMDNIRNDEVRDLIDALLNQREVSERQPINKGKDDWDFFTYASMYLIWQFYAVAVDELVLTTIFGVLSVTVLSLVFIPHWTAAFFVAPFISILYVDLLGVLQFAGIHVNAVSYVSLVMSIGLLVDFLIHILLRYYEIPGDRKTRTIEMLRTMGSSVFLGGASTFLGVIPLAFSTSSIFTTIFVTFIGLVALGVGHGLVLLPVVLSICGPEINPNQEDATAKEKNAEIMRPTTMQKEGRLEV
eukprot:CAMPEP_0119570782 /NCGR_PEP_ID=MMETSP1352-20130426/43788_1 /TAXON_ID=265584 /ORGANISM="Stauroneis constricta, Strain CCMP1120" /LENGTH=1044 /DNA_ID=CAMNT_0007620455 /DNA_START=143 /DNA_END=3276 /DNA_ORIENTATION=+